MSSKQENEVRFLVVVPLDPETTMAMHIGMPRPPDISSERLDFWRRRYEEVRLQEDPELFETPEETYFAISWLEEQLGATDTEISEEAYEVAFAAGQISFGRDPWEVMKLVLEDYRRGVKYEPGDALAHQLEQGQLDNRFGPGPGLHSPDAIKRMMDALGIEKPSDILRMLNVQTKGEAKALVQSKLKEYD